MPQPHEGAIRDAILSARLAILPAVRIAARLHDRPG
jgi:hypothetical protein